jgi:cobalt-precorrin-5B (C1)-methyltransferase
LPKPAYRVTIAGGFAKLVKLSQGARDLHSGRSQIDFADLARLADGLAPPEAVAACNTAQQALAIAGPELAARVAAAARATAAAVVEGAPVAIDVLVVDRDGRAIALAEAGGARVLG